MNRACGPVGPFTIPTPIRPVGSLPLTSFVELLDPRYDRTRHMQCGTYTTRELVRIRGATRCLSLPSRLAE